MSARQIGFKAMCTHNPEMEECHVPTCTTVLFGEVYVLQLSTPDGKLMRSWEMCSHECYVEQDQRIEAWFSSQDDFIACIDDGIPEDW